MRTLSFRGILAGLCILLLAACSGPESMPVPQQAATPLPATATPVPPSATPVPPTPTTEPTATPTIEPTATPAPDTSLSEDWVAFTDEARGLIIYHPADWDVIQPTADRLSELIEQAEDGVAGESIQGIFRQLTDTPGALDHFAALGILLDDPTLADTQFASNFTGIVVPVEGLTLDTYVEIVGAQLGGLDAIAIHNAQVEGGLRPGGLDVASLRYSIDGAALYDLPEGTQIDGWQVAFYDTDGERFLILSLTGMDENFPELEEMFTVLIANVQFE